MWVIQGCCWDTSLPHLVSQRCFLFFFQHATCQLVLDGTIPPQALLFMELSYCSDTYSACKILQSQSQLFIKKWHVDVQGRRHRGGWSTSQSSSDWHVGWVSNAQSLAKEWGEIWPSSGTTPWRFFIYFFHLAARFAFFNRAWIWAKSVIALFARLMFKEDMQFEKLQSSSIWNWMNAGWMGVCWVRGGGA